MRVFFISTRGKRGSGLNFPCPHTKAMREMGIIVYPFEYYRLSGDVSSLLVEKAKEFCPDVLLMFKCPEIKLEAFEELRRWLPQCKFVMWYGDQRGEELYREIAERQHFLNLLLINNSAQFDFYRQQGIKRVGEWHIACDPEVHKPYSPSGTWDIAFGGGNYGERFPLSRERWHLIIRVREKYGLAVYGNGWPFSHPFIFDEDEYCRRLSQADITLGINHYDVEHYYTRRIWHCLAVSRLHLTRYIPGMERDFENRKHLVWFSTIEEALDLIDYYLKHEEEREEIARTGRELVCRKHTYVHRYRQLLEMMEEG